MVLDLSFATLIQVKWNQNQKFLKCLKAAHTEKKEKNKVLIEIMLTMMRALKAWKRSIIHQQTQVVSKTKNLEMRVNIIHSGTINDKWLLKALNAVYDNGNVTQLKIKNIEEFYKTVFHYYSVIDIRPIWFESKINPTEVEIVLHVKEVKTLDLSSRPFRYVPFYQLLNILFI